MNDHYFSPGPKDEPLGATHSVRFRARGHDLDMVAASRVFSGASLDLGTAQLLEKAPPLPEGGAFLDLGCGWGPVAATLALERPNARVWAVDVNRLALALTKENVKRLGLPNVTVLQADTALARARDEDQLFDIIWSNPPIRVGKTALHEMLGSWLPLLTPQGAAYLVVSRNLGADSLAQWLRTQSYRVERIASKKGYRVLQVTRG